jgi:2-phospho-L-lactate guanylyltransferase
MAEDVVAALAGARCLAGIALLGCDPDLAAVGGQHACRRLPEDPQRDWCANLDAAAAMLAAEGVGALLVVPGDLPTLQPADVVALLRAHRDGVTVCPAARDGGTNALVMTPPGAVRFRFGSDSARRHLDAARSKDIPATELALKAFERDIDTPEDIAWLAQQAVSGRATRYLARVPHEPAAEAESEHVQIRN